MKFKRTTIATLITSLCATTAWALPTVTITQNSPSQIELPNNGQLESIIIKPNNVDILDPKNIGSKDKPIADLNVAQGINRNDISNGGGKAILNVFADKAYFGGHGVNLTYDTSVGGTVHKPINGSSFSFDVGSFTSKATYEGGKKYIALSVGNESSITINAKEDVLLEGKRNNAMNVGENSVGKITAKNIHLISDSDTTANTFSTSLKVTSDGEANLVASQNIVLDKRSLNSSAYGIDLGEAGQINLSAGGDISILGKTNQTAIKLNQTQKGNSYSEDASIHLKASNILLNGRVTASMDNNKSTNGIFLNASDGLLQVDATSDEAAIYGSEKANFQATSTSLVIANSSKADKASGIYLDKSSVFNGSFKTTAQITAGTGIYSYSNNSTFSLSGSHEHNSSLIINASVGGIIANSSKGGCIRDTSIDITLDRQTDIPKYYSTPAGQQGIVGLLSQSNGKLELINSSSTGKHLNININANASPIDTSYFSTVKTSAISAVLGDVTIENFENLTFNVENKGKLSESYGLRSVSGNILMNKGIGDVSIIAVDGNALYSSSYNGNPSGLIDISSKTLLLQGTGEKGKGINANDNGSVKVVTSDQLSIIAKKAITVASSGSTVNIAGESTNLSLIKGDWSVKEGNATVALGTSAVVEGKLQADKLGTIDLSLGKLGTLQGSTATDFEGEGTGTVNLTMANGSVWNVTEDSTASVLTLTDSTIDFSRWNTTTKAVDTQNYNSVKSKTFTGDNNTLRMQIDLANETKDKVLTDQLNITGQALGTHTADLKIDGKDLVPNKFHSENWLISQGADSNMSILNKEGKNQYSGRGMVTTWGLAFVANGEEDKLNTAEGLAELVGNTTGKGEGKWYLVRNDEEIVDPTPDPDPEPEQPGPNDPAEMQQITNLGISATQALSFASELEDLRGRLGEVRYGAQDGAWVRAGYTKEKGEGYNGRGFDQKTSDLHIGLDRLVAQDEDSSWLVGGALRYAKSKQEGFTAARGGEGELEQYSAKLYATYMHAQGSYADFVLQVGRYSQDLTGLANDLSSAFKADYKTYGYGASVEIGHMFDFNNQVDDRQWFNHFFIEPQLQLSYFNAHGKDYKTSTGLAVSQSDADFLTGRAGVVVGKKFNYGTADDLDKRYFQVGLKGGVKYEFLGDQTIRFTGIEGITKERKADDVDGARYYYGVTADWQLSNNFRAYATVEREEGDHYTKDFDVSVGVKYQF